jgi:phenylpropionate dioxygenase-like ring-hydroxylating dioxygenase large terminal subunit
MTDLDTSIKRGHASAASPLTRDLLAADSHPLPKALQSTGRFDPLVRPIAFSRYFDPGFAKLERERLWSKVWQYACRDEDIPAVGDRVRYDVGSMSFMIVRSAPDEIRAFYNSCLHRGTRLCSGPASSDSIRCPFHAWEWKLDGSLHNIPSRWDFPELNTEAYHLPEIRTARWGGFVFVNPDPHAAPLEKALGILPEHFTDWRTEDRFTFVHVHKRLRANWKITLEAFLEAYHVIETHFDALPFTGDASTQYDIWDDGHSHVSRLITPLGVPSPHLGDAASRQAALDMFVKMFGMSLDPNTVLPSFDTAKGAGRANIAAWRRQMLQAQFGRDFSGLCDAELIDTVQYFMFPNFCPWYGEGLPLVYQFLPCGDDPNESVMGIRLLMPLPGGDSPRPPAAPVIELDFDEPFSAVPEFGMLGGIFDQDMSNLPSVQAGLKASSSGHARATLGRYQESRIQHFENTLDRYLGISP